QLEMAEISAIRVDGQILAAELEFHHADTTFAYQSGLAEAGLEHSGGSLSLLGRIRSAIAHRRSTYDLMRGNEAYKFHWNAVEQPTVRLQLRPPTPTGHVSHQTAMLWNGSKRWVKKWIRPRATSSPSVLSK
ncbi:MAG: GNAT family N-acetyltransferase, partial [Novipirellula sp. JB048]